MKMPAIQGIIRRRILVNFRVDPAVMQCLLPAPFQVKTAHGYAMAGICLIRLEQIHPSFIPFPFGVSSENAAHRVAVCWTDKNGAEHEGVFIFRRDTDSNFNHLAGGRLFPGEQHHASFKVSDKEETVDFAMQSDDGKVEIHLHGQESSEFPAASIFSSLAEASALYETGAIGYSATRQGDHAEGMKFSTEAWQVSPLVLESVYSNFFADTSRFPLGSVTFDCALLMRNIPHEWTPMPVLILPKEGDTSRTGAICAGHFLQ